MGKKWIIGFFKPSCLILETPSEVLLPWSLTMFKYHCCTEMAFSMSQTAPSEHLDL